MQAATLDFILEDFLSATPQGRQTGFDIILEYKLPLPIQDAEKVRTLAQQLLLTNEPSTVKFLSVYPGISELLQNTLTEDYIPRQSYVMLSEARNLDWYTTAVQTKYPCMVSQDKNNLISKEAALYALHQSLSQAKTAAESTVVATVTATHSSYNPEMLQGVYTAQMSLHCEENITDIDEGLGTPVLVSSTEN